MKLTMLTIGSRGDVQPMLALARELIGAGHDVTIATHPRFAQLAERAEVPFARIAEGRVGAGASTPEGWRWINSGSRYLPTWVAYVQDARTVVRERLGDALTAGAGSDAIIAADLGILVGWQVAQHLNCPLIRVNLNLPGPLQELTGPLAQGARAALWRAIRLGLKGPRRDLGLPPLPRRDPMSDLNARHALLLKAYTRAIVPDATGGPTWAHPTGFWFLELAVDPEPSAALAEFLAAGAPPVCVDFGSMADADPDATMRLLVDVLHRTGHRGVILTAPHRRSNVELPASVIAVGPTSHTWLFPQCVAAVHHGGAGSTAGALRAGIPSVPVAHTEDQMRLARRMHKLGLASAPIRRRRLTADSLEAAITASAAMRDRAAALRPTIESEHGTVRARELIEGYLGHARPSQVPPMLNADLEVA